MRRVRLLVRGDERLVEKFLRERLESSVFLLSNLCAAGLSDREGPYQGTWLGAFDGPRLVGVACHAWNGMLLLQASDPGLAREAIARSGCDLSGLLGPWAQVRAVLPDLRRGRRVLMESRQPLFTLPIERLRIPPALSSGELFVRDAHPGELDVLVSWRVDYEIVATGARASLLLEASARETMFGLLRKRRCRVLESEGLPVSTAAINAHVGDVVQVGGVYTPPALRGRGYARAVVAGLLSDARAEGATRAVLFTAATNHAAQRAYTQLGFEPAGEYGVAYFG